MGEIWIPIERFIGLYEVSNLGRVRSLDRSHKIANRWGSFTVRKIRGSILSPGEDKDGYLQVGLHGAGRVIYRKVHVLVAAAFIGPRPFGFDVAHEDNDKSNNCVGNISYQTHQENCEDRIRHGVQPMGETSSSAKISLSDVISIRERHKNGEGYKSIAKDFPIHATQVRRIVIGERWAHF